MSETITVEVTKDQKEILLRGLRLVRSAVLLDINDLPTAESEEQRQSELRRVTSLTEQISKAPVLVH